jgi:hypothetical protein
MYNLQGTVAINMQRHMALFPLGWETGCRARSLEASLVPKRSRVIGGRSVGTIILTYNPARLVFVQTAAARDATAV